MTTDDAPRGEPLSDETLRKYEAFATGDWYVHGVLRALLAEVSRLRAENATLRAENGRLAGACEMVLHDVGDGGPASDYVSAYTAEVIREALAGWEERRGAFRKAGLIDAGEG